MKVSQKGNINNIKILETDVKKNLNTQSLRS